MKNTIFIALGTNLGKREMNLETAINEIAEFAQIIKRSSIYETKPFGYKEQPDFLNMAIEIITELTPPELIIKLQEIEHKMGRDKENEIENGPRIIDLDILFYNDEIINYPNLRIPHPRLNNRNFVLKPLAEIAPNFVHPLEKKDIQTLFEELNTPKV